ncbi:hypothetical protein G3I74_06055 [Wenzhouxiangella sp. C33]|uniref:Uncharacterized protein n=2 Tax=Wenzhouxiangella limi TaxID=2707351 RepID=A0A845UX81_9GAMM|nr:hypothetical protein [Wenzhouxiangella limi]
MLVTAVALWGGFVAWALHGENYGTLFPDLMIEPDPLDWRLTEGKGALSPEGMEIHEPGDRARWVLAIRLPTILHAKRYDRLQVLTNNAGLNHTLTVHWSRTPQYLPAGGLPLSVTENGVYETRLSDLTGWQDQIYFLGLESFGAPRNQFSIKALRLHQAKPDLRSLHRRIAEDWFAFPSWSQQSINFIRSGAEKSHLSLLVAIAIWVLATGLALMALSTSRCRQALPWLTVPLVFGWLILDLRWQITLLANSAQAVTQLASLSLDEKREVGHDENLYRFLNALSDLANPEFGGRVFAIGRNEYWRTRVRYHLLPLSVRTAGSNEWNQNVVSAMQPGDVILLLDTPGISKDKLPDELRYRIFPNQGKNTYLLVELIANTGDFKAFRVLEKAARQES